MCGHVKHLRILGKVALQDAHKIGGRIHLIHGHSTLDPIEPDGLFQIAACQVCD